jgi:hypothetical protein
VPVNWWRLPTELPNTTACDFIVGCFDYTNRAFISGELRQAAVHIPGRNWNTTAAMSISAPRTRRQPRRCEKGVLDQKDF